jgi:hypothetical protein
MPELAHRYVSSIRIDCLILDFVDDRNSFLLDVSLLTLLRDLDLLSPRGSVSNKARDQLMR